MHHKISEPENNSCWEGIDFQPELSGIEMLPAEEKQNAEILLHMNQWVPAIKTHCIS